MSLISSTIGSSSSSLPPALPEQVPQISPIPATTSLSTSSNNENFDHNLTITQKTDQIAQKQVFDQIRRIALRKGSILPTSEQLTRMLGVIHDAILHPDPRVETTAKSERVLVEIVTNRSVNEYINKAKRLRTLCARRYQEVTDCDLNKARIAQVMQETRDPAELAQLTFRASQKSIEAKAARKLLEMSESDKEQFDISLKRLIAQLSEHPWRNLPSFQKAITVISDELASHFAFSTLSSRTLPKPLINLEQSPTEAVNVATSSSTHQTISSKTTILPTSLASARPIDEIFDQARIALNKREYQNALNLILNNSRHESQRRLSEDVLEDITRAEILGKAYQGLRRHEEARRIATIGLSFRSLLCAWRKEVPRGELCLILINAYCSLGDGETAMKEAYKALDNLSPVTECGQDIHVYLYLAAIRGWCIFYKMGKEIDDILAADYESPLDKVNAFNKCYNAMKLNGHDTTWVDHWHRQAQDLASILQQNR